MAVAPALTRAAILGMALTTAQPAGQNDSRSPRVTPAAMDRARLTPLLSRLRPGCLDVRRLDGEDGALGRGRSAGLGPGGPGKRRATPPSRL